MILRQELAKKLKREPNPFELADGAGVTAHTSKRTIQEALSLKLGIAGGRRTRITRKTLNSPWEWKGKELTSQVMEAAICVMSAKYAYEYGLAQIRDRYAASRAAGVVHEGKTLPNVK